MGGGVSRSVTGFVDAGVLVVFVVLSAVGMLIAPRVARRLGTTTAVAGIAVASIAAILAVTLGVRTGGGWRGVRVGVSWLTDGDLWSSGVSIDTEWLLNVVLFVPAGLFVTVATRRPGPTLLGLIGLSMLIEITQGLTLLGASDPADWVANSLGAAAGVAVGTVALRWQRGSTGRRDRKVPPGVVLIGAVTAVAIVGIGWLGLSAGADARRDSLADEVRTVFADTTAADIAATFATDRAQELFDAVSVRPGYLGQVGDTDDFEARYSIEFFGFHRCVFIRWTVIGFTLRDGAGDECTVFHERPPESSGRQARRPP